MTLVAVIMANTSDEKEAGFWKDQQTGLLTAAILYVMYDHTGLTEPTLGGAYNFIINNRLSELERKFRNLDPTHPARIQISDFLTPKRRFSPVPNSDLSRDFKFSSSTPSSRSSPGMRLISLNLEEANAHTLSSCPTRREPLISYQAFSSVCSSLRSLPTRILQMSERLRFRFTW